MNRKLPSPPVLVVTDRQQVDSGRVGLGIIIDAALSCGVRWISLREKDLSPHEQIKLAIDLKERCRAFGATISIHGSPEIALRAGTDGVHLPENGDAAAARALLGTGALIGQSAHTIGQVAAANPQFVDYLIVGPAFSTPSKPGYGPVLGADGLKSIVQAARVPIIAIGGIDAETVKAISDTGLSGVAMMGAAMRMQTQADILTKTLRQVSSFNSAVRT